MKSKIIKAYCFARDKHGAINQRRKYSNERYIYHPVEVAKKIRSIGGSEAMICAALLHDCVEDTSATLEEVKTLFGDEIASLVEMLTDVSQKSDGNRRVRKELDRQHTAQASPEAKSIKLADLISNTQSIVAHDPDFARVYLKEKSLLLEVLKEGDSDLYAEAKSLLQASHQALKALGR